MCLKSLKSATLLTSLVKKIAKKCWEMTNKLTEMISDGKYARHNPADSETT